MESFLFYPCGREIAVGDRVRSKTGGWYGVIDLNEKGELVVKNKMCQFKVAGREKKIRFEGR